VASSLRTYKHQTSSVIELKLGLSLFSQLYTDLSSIPHA